jgi:hypothetical protein
MVLPSCFVVAAELVAEYTIKNEKQNIPKLFLKIFYY